MMKKWIPYLGFTLLATFALLSLQSFTIVSDDSQSIEFPGRCGTDEIHKLKTGKLIECSVMLGQIGSDFKKDSINLIKVQKILDGRGWLSPKIIGNQGIGTQGHLLLVHVFPEVVYFIFDAID